MTKSINVDGWFPSSDDVAEIDGYLEDRWLIRHVFDDGTHLELLEKVGRKRWKAFLSVVKTKNEKLVTDAMADFDIHALHVSQWRRAYILDQMAIAYPPKHSKIIPGGMQSNRRWQTMAFPWFQPVELADAFMEDPVLGPLNGRRPGLGSSKKWGAHSRLILTSYERGSTFIGRIFSPHTQTTQRPLGLRKPWLTRDRVDRPRWIERVCRQALSHRQRTKLRNKLSPPTMTDSHDPSKTTEFRSLKDRIALHRHLPAGRP